MTYSVALNLLTENFKKGTQTVTNGFNDIKSSALKLAGVFGLGLGLGDLVTKMIEVAKASEKSQRALKLASDGAFEYAKNQKYLIELSRKYGLDLDNITVAYAKYTSSAKLSNISIKDQQTLFTGLNAAMVANGVEGDKKVEVFDAMSKMMQKGTIQLKPLISGLGDALPQAIEIMAKSMGVSVEKFRQLAKSGKLLTEDVFPKFGTALSSTFADVDTDTIEGGLKRLNESFEAFVDKIKFQDAFKSLINSAGTAFDWIVENLKKVGQFFISIATGVIVGKAIQSIIRGYKALSSTVEATYIKAAVDARKSALEQELAGDTRTKKEQLNYKKQELAATESFAKQGFAANKFSIVAGSAFKSVGIALKSAFSSIGIMLVISLITEAIIKLVEWGKNQKRINNLYSDFEKGAKNAGKNTAAENELKNLKRIYDDNNRSDAERKTALNSINSILGTTYRFNLLDKKLQEEINGKYRDRLDLIAAQTQYQYYTNQSLAATSKLEELAQDKNNKIEDKKAEAEKVVYGKYGENKDSERILGQIFNIIETNKGKVDDNLLKQFDTKVVFGRGGIGGSVSSYIYNPLKKILDDSAKEHKKYNNNKEVKEQTKINISSANNQNAIKTQFGDVIDGGSGSGLNNLNTDIAPPKPAADKTPLQKEEEIFNNTKTELANKLANGAITTIEEFNKLMNDLFTTTFDNLSGMLTVDEANKNTLFKEVKEGKKNTEISKTAEIQKEYDDKLLELKDKLELKRITEEEYTNSLNDLTSNTIDNINSVKNLDDASIKFKNTLLEKEKELKKLKFKSVDAKQIATDIIRGNKSNLDFTKSPEENAINSAQLNIEINSAQLDEFKNALGDTYEQVKDAYKFDEVGNLTIDYSKIDELKSKFDDAGDALLNSLTEGMKKIPDLESALKIAEIQKYITDLKTNAFSNITNDIQTSAGAVRNLVEAFKDFEEISKDNDLSGFEKMLSYIDTITNAVNAMISAWNGITAVVTFIKELSTAKKELAKPAAKVVEAGAELAAAGVTVAANAAVTKSNEVLEKSYIELMAAKITALYASSPIGIVAAGLSIAAMVGLVKGASTVTKLAKGGIVYGNSLVNVGEYAGASTNPEVIAPLDKLKKLINPNISGSSGTSEVVFKLEGSKLIGCINNYNKKNNIK